MKEVKQYNKACNELAKRWIIDYFEIPKDERDELDYTWIGVGSILEFADYYIGMDDILTCYKEKITRSVFFEWYNASLETEGRINLISFFWGAEKTLKKEEESLRKSEKSSMFAKEYFDKQMRDFEERAKI